MRFGSYRAFGPNARRSRLAMVPDTNQEAHNQIWRSHSVPTSLVLQDQNSTETTSAVRFVQGFRSERSALALRARASPLFRTSGITHYTLHITLTIKSEDLTPFLCHWLFRIKGVLKRPAVKDISRKSPCEFFFSYILMCCRLCQCCKPRTRPMRCPATMAVARCSKATQVGGRHRLFWVW